MNSRNKQVVANIISCIKFIFFMMLIIFLVRGKNTYKNSLEKVSGANSAINGYLEKMVYSLFDIHYNLDILSFNGRDRYKVYQDGFNSPYIFTTSWNLRECSPFIDDIRQFFEFILPTYENKEFTEFTHVENLYASMQNFIFLYGSKEDTWQLYKEDMSLFKEYSELFYMEVAKSYQRLRVPREFSLELLLSCVDNFNEKVENDVVFQDLVEKYMVHAN